MIILRAILNVLVKLSGVICRILKLASGCGKPFACELSTSKSARPASASQASLSIITSTSFTADEARRKALSLQEVKAIITDAITISSDDNLIIYFLMWFLFNKVTIICEFAKYLNSFIYGLLLLLFGRKHTTSSKNILTT